MDDLDKRKYDFRKAKEAPMALKSVFIPKKVRSETLRRTKISILWTLLIGLKF